MVTKAKGVKVFNFTIGSAQDYWRQITEPDIRAFEKTPQARQAAHVMQSLWAVLEWEACEKNITAGDLLKEVEKECPELQWIRDIAFSAKHCSLTSRTQVRHAGYLQTGRAGYGTGTAYGSHFGGYGTLAFVATFHDGTSIPLVDIVKPVAEFYRLRHSGFAEITAGTVIEAP